MPEGDSAPKVRGRGSARFASAFGGSGLLAWSSEDVDSPPSELALNPRRSSRSRSRGDKERSRKNRLLDGPLEPERRRQQQQQPRREGEPRPKREPRSKWVKVTNIPGIAKPQHIRYLFASKGAKVLDCIIEGKTAFICFERFEHAAGAVKQYNGGDINGTKIVVELEFSPPVAKDAGKAKEKKKEEGASGGEKEEESDEEDEDEGEEDEDAEEPERRVVKLDAE